MSVWTLAEYAAWGLSAFFGFRIVADWLTTDRNYAEDVLMSSREGEIEAMTEEHKVFGGGNG